MTIIEPSTQTPKPDPISAEVERALFKRFWAWLGVVGSIVIVVTSGVSVLLSQAASSLIDTRVSAAIEKINGLEAKSRESIDRIEARAIDAAISTNAKQAQAIVAADSAQSAITILQTRLNSLPKLDEALKDTDSIVATLLSKQDFIGRVSVGASHSVDRTLSRLLEWGQAADAPRVNINGGYGPITSTCPPGYYAVGITAWGNSAGPYCIGCFVATQILCRRLNVEQQAQSK